MEDYDTFVQRRLSQLRKNEEEEEQSRPSPASSLIRVYGRAILPPLLSGEQREEMQRHRDEAQKAAGHRELQDDPRMAYVQAVLHSVQLRKTPTLEELLQEAEMNTRALFSLSTSAGSESRSDVFSGTKDSLRSPPTVRKGKDGLSPPSVTSTTCSAFFTSNATPQQSYHEECLVDQHDGQRRSQPSSLNGVIPHSPPLSSGYVTYENVQNTVDDSALIDAASVSRGFGPAEAAHSVGGFFLHSTSNTIAKMPEIISHPPIDGEELERSGLESSFCNNFIAVQDIFCTPFQEDSVVCDRLPAEESESSRLDCTESEDNSHSASALDLDKDHIFKRTEDAASSSENSGLSDDSELSETLSTPNQPTTELQSQHEPTETEPADNHEDEAKPAEEPYRLSLQALLKKSQEYRRRQRMLRNQARNTKIQERTQEQPRARAEEQSLSDKENDESPYKGTVNAEGKKTKERRGTFILTGEKSLKKSWERERDVESEGKSESTRLTGDEEETTFKNNKLNSSREIATEPKQTGTFIHQQPVSTEAFYLTGEQSAASSTGVFKGAGKYHTIPAPHLCTSPVHCKSRGSIRDGGPAHVTDTSKGRVVVGTGLNEARNVEEESRNSHTTIASPSYLVVEGDVTGVLVKSSEHIDQLESNLSCLKVLISDLESTVKENLESHGQTGSSRQGGFSFTAVELSAQSGKDPHLNGYGEDEPRDDAECRERPGSRVSRTSENVHEDAGPELILSEAHEFSCVLPEKSEEAVNLTEIRLVKTLASEREKERGGGKEGLVRSCGPPAKCVVLAAQRLRVPEAFRNVPSETSAARDFPVLSDASNHPAGMRNEAAAEGHDSAGSPSLNLSYDVDAPSGLWLLNGSEPDLGSKGQGTRLTPESGGGGQGGVSRVKRRLLMHATQESQDRGADTGGGGGGGAGSVVRPSSSTPRGAAQWFEGHGHQNNKQEQLKQVHAAQVRALQDEHRRQQEELLQALAVRYRLLQSASFPCSTSTSRLGDTLTFSPLSQPPGPPPVHHRPLLAAAAKGFLTRRLLRTERVAQLARTIRDTQQFLRALQQQSPDRAELCGRQDLLLQQRVTLQLRAARYEVYDVFFSLSAAERMQLISWDRELVRERELRRQSGHIGHPRGKSSLSAATQKALERKRGMMMQKKAAERHRGAEPRTGHKTGISAEPLLETKRGQFRANPQRVPKSTYSSRPR